MKNHRNKSRALVCCISCGRDTRNITAVCSRCGGRGATAISDQRGRRCRSTVALSHQIREDRYDEECEP